MCFSLAASEESTGERRVQKQTRVQANKENFRVHDNMLMRRSFLCKYILESMRECHQDQV